MQLPEGEQQSTVVVVVQVVVEVQVVQVVVVVQFGNMEIPGASMRLRWQVARQVFRPELG